VVKIFKDNQEVRRFESNLSLRKEWLE